MKRHDFDVVSLVTGVLFLGLAIAYLVGEATGTDFDARWVAPAVLVILGTTGLLASLSRLGREAGSRVDGTRRR